MPVDQPTPVVEVVHLTKRFRASVRAVDDLSFSVREGDVCGLLGPNGAGKTTTLRVLLGLIHPSAGEARLFGERVRSGDPKLRRVGALIEESAFVPHLPGLTNLRFYWEAGGGDWAHANVEDALAIAGLGDAIHRRVKTYSHGMRQRLGIARALLGNPEVLILDEPTTGLDPQEMREIRDLIRRLSGGGVTILLSSHLLSEVEQVCSHAIVMNQGRLVAAGTVAELVGTRESVYFEVDDVPAARRVLEHHAGVQDVEDEPPGLGVHANGTARAELVAALVAAGVGVETVTSRHRLEDVFLGIVGEEGSR